MCSYLSVLCNPPAPTFPKDRLGFVVNGVNCLECSPPDTRKGWAWVRIMVSILALCSPLPSGLWPPSIVSNFLGKYWDWMLKKEQGGPADFLIVLVLCSIIPVFLSFFRNSKNSLHNPYLHETKTLCSSRIKAVPKIVYNGQLLLFYT